MSKKITFKKFISIFLVAVMLFQLDGVRVLAAELKNETIKEIIQQTLQEEVQNESNQESYQEKSEEIIINSIELETKEIDYDDSTKIYIDIENIEDVQYIVANYNIPNYSDYNFVTLDYNPKIGKFEGDILPSYNYEYCVDMNQFTLDHIRIGTLNGSEYITRYELGSKYGIREDIADFKVIKKIPEIKSIKIDSNEVNYSNGYTDIYVTTSYPESINEIRIDYNKNGYYSHTINLYYDYSTNSFKGSIYGDRYNSGEKYNFNSITISAFNHYSYETVYRNDLQSSCGINPETLDYIIVKEKIHIKSLVVENNTIYPNIYQASAIKLNMEVENQQDIYSVKVRYGSRYNDYSDFYVYMEYNYETGQFEGKTYPYNYMLGENEVKEVYIYKYYGTITLNKEDLKTYENIDLDSLTVNIIPYGPKDIYVDTKALNVNETVTIKADLSNYPLEIKTVRLNYNYNLNSGSEFYIEMKYNESTGLYEGQYTVGRLTEDGIKTLHAIEIVDKNSNCNVIYNDSYEINLNNANFEVVNNINKFIYSLKVKAESNKAELSDKVKVSVSGVNLINGSVQAKYINLNTNEEKYILLNYNKKSKNWEGYFNVDTYLSDGIWILDSINLGESLNFSFTSKDVYNKEIYKNKEYTKDLSNADIKVTGTISDTKAPELIALSVNKKQAQVGDNVIITIDAKDDLSGIKEIGLTYYNGSSYISTNEVKVNPITGKYEAYIKINGVDLNGTYKLSNILLTDNANNKIYITNNNMFGRYTDIYDDLSDANFEVINNIDYLSQIITSLTVNKKEVQTNEDVEVSMTLANRTGVDNIFLTYSNDEEYKEVILNYDEESNQYKGVLKLDSYTKLGKWQIQDVFFINSNNVYIASIHRNNNDVQQILDEGTFDIVIKNDESLKLTLLNIDKNRVTNNEKVTIQAKASDINGEIRKIIVEYISQEGKTLNINLKETSNGFIGEFLVEKYTSPGKWKVNSVLLEDNERNRAIIYNTEINQDEIGSDLSKANIEVYGTTLDNKVPILLNAEFEKDIYEYGDKVKLSITAKDDISGIKSVKASFSPSRCGDQDKLLEFTYNEENDNYEYIIDTTQTNIYNKNWIITDDSWSINVIEIEDNAGNIYRSYNHENEILRSAYFYVYTTGKWFIEELTDKSDEINGVTEPNANIEVTVENETYICKADEFGKFKVAISPQEGNKVVNIKVTNSLGVVIQSIEKIVKDLDAPDAPTVTTVVNNKTTILEGISEPNSVVVIEKEVKVFGGLKIEEIASTVADSEGKFKVNIPMQSINTYLGIKAIDKVGNVSEYANIIVKNINREDVNYDDIIDILDLALVARKYNTVNGDNMWDTNLDVNEDGVVDIFDIVMISKKME